MILGPETQRLDALEAREPVTVDAVAGVLPDAVARAAASDGSRLAVALEPSVTTALSTVARREADQLGEILAPTIGASVRKAVADAISALIARFNVALERSLSIESVRWRIEAARTGRPFAEVVMLRTLRYRVEQIILVHGATSLVLQHVVDPSVSPQPPDQAAAMLAAIDAFGREALGPLPPGSHLDRFEFGELTVCMSHGPWMTLCAVVRGAVPAEIADRLREARERVLIRFQSALEGFAGDVAPFDGARDELVPLLQAERRPPSRAPRFVFLALALCAVSAAAIAVGRSISHRSADRRLEEAYASALGGEPGIVLTSASWRNGRGRFVGFRDPSSASPADVVSRRGLPPLLPSDLELAPFLSLEPTIRQDRIRRALAPPPAVVLIVDGSVLRMVGTAPAAWIERAADRARLMPAVEEVDTGDLRSDESLIGLWEGASRLQASGISFGRGSSAIPPETEASVDRAAERASDLLGRAREAHLTACIAIEPLSDESGTDEQNRRIRAARATAVLDALVARGVPPGWLRVRPEPSAPPEPSRPAVDLHADIGCGEQP